MLQSMRREELTAENTAIVMRMVFAVLPPAGCVVFSGFEMLKTRREADTAPTRARKMNASEILRSDILGFDLNYVCKQRNYISRRFATL